MENQIFDQLVSVLPLSASFTVGLTELSAILERENQEKTSSFIRICYQSIFKLESWAWKLLSRDSYQWIDQPNYLELFHSLAIFNRNLVVFYSDIEDDIKAALLIPLTIDVINGILEQTESTIDDQDPLIRLASIWFENLALFIHDYPQYDSSLIISHLNHCLARDYLMTDQMKFYLIELQQAKLPQSILTTKMMFYMKTTSFSLCSYLMAKSQTFGFSAEQMIEHIVEGFIHMIHIQSYIIEFWSESLLSCITHLTGFISACCWWGGEKFHQIKSFFPTEQMIYSYIDALIRMVSYQPFHRSIEDKWINDQTILLDLTLFSLKTIIQNQDFIWFFRSKRSFPDTLLRIAEISVHDKICLRACIVLGEILCDTRLKDLKITDNVSVFFFDILLHAWQHPTKKYKQIPIIHLLKGFLNLSKIDAIQQKAADLNKISLLIEMTDEYPVIFEILWALSFNTDIQHQLRSNATFMTKLIYLAKESENEQQRKATHGILWNLRLIHQDRLMSETEDSSIFDIMISYSHKDQIFCRKIYEELIRRGYRVWIDFDQIHGNVMDAMAQAIEQSQMILICMSEQYRRSNYCRAEAHYAFQRQLRLVPVLLQEHYQPDGWLLFLIGQLLYVDFTKHEFTHSIDLLIKELRAESTITSLRSRRGTKTGSFVSPLPLKPSVPIILPKKMHTWSKFHVQQWLISHELVHMSHLLSETDGRALIYLSEFLKRNEYTEIVRLLQEDSLRRTNENLSLIELSNLRSLIEQYQSRTSSRRSIKRLTRNTDKKYLRHCCSMM